MKKNILVKRLAIPGGIVFIVSVLGLLIIQPLRDANYRRHVKRLNNRIATLTMRYQDYLFTLAGAIKQLPVDPSTLTEIQSKMMEENPNVQSYLWMSSDQGEFVFGAPSAVFLRMNQGYDRYQEVIQSDGYYMDRDDFLEKLVDKHDAIDFSEFATPAMDANQYYEFRVYDENRHLRRSWDQDHQYYTYYRRPRVMTLSARVTDADGRSLGNLFIKIDDSANRSMYLNKRRLEINDLFNSFVEPFRVLAIISGMFLWFLMPSWVYMDAQQRDVKSPGMWATLALISAVFGLAIYLITRPASLKIFRCPECEHELNGSKAFCPHCGHDLSANYCPQCQYPIKPDWVFCPNCRAGLKDEQNDEESPTPAPDEV